ncbi:DUF2808 domain-containing protein [Aerosakkonema funiforme]|uniref:DUF2808 domain-containing protein n=1 Tax=Aerosakkonema funiforme TaxID=1246630 RepID=UPI0035B89DB1
MARILIYAAALTLAAGLKAPAVYGNHTTAASRFPYIVSSVQFPPTKARIFRHTFRLQIPEGNSAISQLNINVPSGLTVRDNISISDQSGRNINANVSVNGSQVIVVFPQPVVPGTRLKIEMNNVRRTGVSNAWLYPVSARFVGINADIPIGVAEFHVY